MHYYYRNINDAFYGVVKGVIEGGILTRTAKTRNGEVRRVVGPATISYSHPTERVLLNRVRDCNPFFHLYESLWMLAGRNDVASLDYYNSRMKEYSDDGTTFHGAYGHRWRHHFGTDQLNDIYNILYHIPHDRRAVLQMWDSLGARDLSVGSGGGKDVPCNVFAVFEMENRKLNLTVFNRSNDLLWGMMGANVVQFSVLQEYMAARLGARVGELHQVSVNLHIYKEHWRGRDYLDEAVNFFAPSAGYYPRGELVPLVADPVRFESELQEFVDNQEASVKEPFLAEVAAPMCLAFRHHKERDYGRALEALRRVRAADWASAGETWINRRRIKYIQRQSPSPTGPTFPNTQPQV